MAHGASLAALRTGFKCLWGTPAAVALLNICTVVMSQQRQWLILGPRQRNAAESIALTSNKAKRFLGTGETAVRVRMPGSFLSFGKPHAPYLPVFDCAYYHSTCLRIGYILLYDTVDQGSYPNEILISQKSDCCKERQQCTRYKDKGNLHIIKDCLRQLQDTDSELSR